MIIYAGIKQKNSTQPTMSETHYPIRGREFPPRICRLVCDEDTCAQIQAGLLIYNFPIWLNVESQYPDLKN